MKKSSQNVKIFQWNSRPISTNILAFENHMSQSNYCILGLQSLNVEKRNLPRMNNYYYPPLCNSNKNTKKVQTAIYIFAVTLYILFPFHLQLQILWKKSMLLLRWLQLTNRQRLMSSLCTFQMDQKVTTQTGLKTLHCQNKCYVIVGDFNAHAPFGENGCTSVTCNRLVENIVDSSLCLLNDGRITRIPDVPTHKATATELSLVTPDLAVNCTWYTEENCLGSD